MIFSRKILLTLALLLSILPVLGLAKISGSSEAREAHVARVIMQTGEWILPDRNGYVPSKPVLHHWLISIVSYIPGEVSEFTARLPAALLGILLIVYITSYVSSLTRLNLAVFSGLVLISCYGFFRMLFSSMVDLTFAFFCTVAMLTAVKPLTEETDLPAASWNRFFFFSGLATLAKGPLGLILPCLFAGVFYIVMRGFKSALKNCLKPKISWLIWVALALPWYVLAYLKSQAAFLERQLLFENLERFTGGQHINAEPFWFYLPSFISRMAPWSILILFAGILLLGARNAALKPQLKLIKAFSLSLLSAVLFFSLASGKRHSYLLPLFPVFTVLLVLLLDYFRNPEAVSFKFCDNLCKKLKSFRVEDFSFRIAKFLSMFFLAMYAAVFVFLYFYAGDKAEINIAARFIFSNVFLILLAPLLSYLCVFLCRNYTINSEKAQISVLFLFASVFSSTLACIYGIKGEYRDYPAITAAIKEHSGSRKIYAVRDKFDELLDPVFFYLGEPVKIFPPSSITEVCRQDEAAVVLMRNTAFKETGQILRSEAVFREQAGNSGSLKDREIVLLNCITD